ncbi:Similar to S.cerevisiae protein COX19 (Protein required for cytochrome c oxidase assembly) [Malassezia sympodialis ATCC 42132]|uniref:Similar to S.cerevisiae protein COX19 (Protein required for cytochrome c oxidase assembly) n=1 Tax=Malassezia sympodialis (strain ATCC 42132) TaxID=1230383 RepID=A0A1M8AAH7_MALS4|nr:Similar to S.cerevisiae protein COX19 (Protein required for cytochrome c oxidase assembly) [Malassezia sympodialis ATCC 42132]
MSFGRPPTFSNFQVLPPERGSFPLDHDGECTAAMREYLACLKAHQNNNGACRHLSKAYLACRMENELMEKDSFANLGFADIPSSEPPPAPAPEPEPKKDRLL